MTSQTKHSKRKGSAMLDVVGASLVTALVMVPSVNILRQSRNVNSRIQIRQEMTIQCSSLIEQEIADLSTSTDAGTHTGKLASSDENIRYRVIRSDAVRAGGLPDRLMAVSATTWHDEDNDRRIDRTESTYSLFTKVAISATP